MVTTKFLPVRKIVCTAVCCYAAISFFAASPVFAEEKSSQAPVTAMGKVVETMDASGYTYLLVDNGMQKNWVAIPQSQVTVGEQVTYFQGMTMTNFHSNTLDRTFDKVIFSEGLVGTKEKPAAQSGVESNSFAEAVKKEQMQQPEEPAMGENPQGSTGAIVPKQQLQVAKAAEGYSVGEIHAMAKELNTKKVQVRGKIMKINMNIMGKNWVHIQDGTGSPMSNSHDLVVTTTENFNEGDVVLFTGVVAADRDFGAGYTYAVIVEEATGKVE